MNVKFWNVIGLMSGTSLDGVDIVYTCISIDNGIYDFKLIETATISYSKKWEQQLRNAFTASKNDLDELNISYANYLGELVNEFTEKHGIVEVDFFGKNNNILYKNVRFDF